MLRQPRRLLSAGIAIVLGVAFVTAALLFGSSLNASVRQLAGREIGDAAAVITPPDDGNSSSASESVIDQSVIDAVNGAPGVQGTRALYRSYAVLTSSGAQAQIGVDNLPRLEDGTSLAEGRLPQSDEEVAISTHMRDSYGITLGEQITTRSYANEKGPRQSTVVGFVDSDTASRSDYVYATDTGAVAITGIPGYEALMVRGSDPTALRTTLSDLGVVKDGGLTVRTGEEQMQHEIHRLTGESQSITNLLLVFAGIALFVSVIVIANTFSILVAQRARQLAMMRCVGATKGQVLATVLGEALVLGALGSAVGVVLGAGLTWLFLRLGQGAFAMEVPFTASVGALVAPFVVGILITLLSSLGAARKATGVAPLAALHPELATTRAKRFGVVRGVLGGLLLLVGAVLLVAGWHAAGTSDDEARRTATLLTAMSGAGLAFLGVIVLGRGLIPALARLIGAPLRRASVPGDLAVANSRRNPGRAAATANALLVGVTLIGVLTVGAACSHATVDRELGSHFPQDAVVEAPDGVSDEVLDQIRNVPDVSAAELVPTVQAQADDEGTNRDVQVVGVSSAAAGISRVPQRYEGLADGTFRTNDTDFTDGQRVTVSHEGRSVELTADVDSSYSDALVVTPATMTQLSPDAANTAWVRYADKADAQRVTTRIGQIDALKNASINSGAAQRAEYQQMIDAVLLVAMGLLAMAVIIAVVGVGNTLSLSVLERTQELGLLRALGMTKGQVRQMVGWESVTLAAVATVIGLALGVVLGITGAKALLASPGIPLAIQVPWPRLALIAAVALLAGWLASLAPAARAVRVAPSAALTAD